jgi:hypothetical protein
MGAIRTRRARRGLLATALLAVAALTSGCAWVAVEQANPGSGSGDALWIVGPAHRSQLSSNASVPVWIQLPGVKASSLHVTLATGDDLTHRADITSRFTIQNGVTALATLGPADVKPGFSHLEVSGDLTAGGGTVTRQSAFSYEPGIALTNANRCETLGQSRCLLPFPSDRFTVSDPATDTGRRIHFDPASMTKNNNGVGIDPTEWNRNDGFSPGEPILALVPGLSLDQTGAAPVTDIGRSLRTDAPIVVLDAQTGARVPYFAELDANATSDATRTLIIRPARNYTEGHRYIVALRNLKDASGHTISAARSFQVYRDEIPTFIPAVESRRGAMRDIFDRLAAAGVARQGLYLAWDFTVASTRSLTSRVLHIRDDAFASLNGVAPSFTVTNVEDNVTTSIRRRVTGTFAVPQYLTGTGGPGERYHYSSSSPDALPTRNGTWNANFVCNIPSSAVPASGPVNPGRALVYGHGLLGNANEVNAFGGLANQYDLTMCATDWIGMSSADVGNVAAILGNLSQFPTLADRLQQGMLDMLFLARLLKDPNGFATNAAFRFGAGAGTPAFKTGEVFFNGNSQGGIMGGATTAISTEWTRAVLGVPGMNYSTLLNRSVDYDAFSPVSRTAYPDDVDQQLDFALIQMLWDRGEANGYARHLTTDTLPGTPAHQVLLIEAFGDFQVANIGTETEARTIPGIRVWSPPLRAGRSLDVAPLWGITPLTTSPYDGSVLVMWDYGTPPAPTTNTPPRVGSDPHGKGASEPGVAAQVDAFLRSNGSFVPGCSGPCVGAGG